MITRDDIKKVLLEWNERELPEIISRDIVIPLAPQDIINITGVRRAGKTFLLLWTIKKLLHNAKKEEILYVNFEHELLQGMTAKDVRKLFEVHAELFKENIKYVFFDEVQKVKDWNIILRRLYDERKYKIFVSGSSSELRPNELAHSLRGRTINYTVFPLSFKEFLRFKNYEFDEKKILLEEERGRFLRLFKEFLIFGGFPDVVLRNNETEKIKLISSYFDTILLRDIMEKYEIRNVRLLELFIKYLLSTASFYFSATKTENYFRSIGEKCSKATLLDFLEHAEKAFLIFKIEIFSYKIKDRKQYPVKIYCIDNAFVNFVNPRFSESIGPLMENLVAIELMKKKVNDGVELYYFKDQQGREVDFIIKEGTNVAQLIQVSYASGKDEVEKREIKSLLKASEQLKCKDLLIITWDYDDEEEVNGKKIKYLPLWKWLLRA